MTEARPYSPQTLAERWGCSAEKVRTMYRSGELAGFELGKLIRIPALEVERFECQGLPSQNTEENGLSHSETANDAGESRLARMTAPTPRVSLVTSGSASTPHEASD